MSAFSTGTALAKNLRLIGAVATIAAGGLIILAGSASSQTVTPQSVDPMQHFLDCAGVLVSAPDVHAANCLPSNIGPEQNSLASSPDDDAPDCITLDAVTFSQDDSDDPCRGDDYNPPPDDFPQDSTGT